ncbi:VirK/YbjX family protein [Hymenobacter glaciei]|uniref:VirK/YbjX family protein n=1 Tax=Hymenobacter glaciei TaxID=877209 RepID=A0ABP7TNZ2_9BACT
MNTALRNTLDKLGLMPLLYAVSPVLTVLNYKEFRALKQATAQLPLGPLLQRQPRFYHKYLSPYASVSFGRKTRLAVIANHYQFLKEQANAAFFPALAQEIVLWRDCVDSEEFSISLSFPIHVDYEAELSLHFSMNGTIIQVVSFVIAPGAAVGATAPQVMLFTQVQGLANAEQIRRATKLLYESTPATLLVQAAYGLALAWGIECAGGVSTEGKAGKWVYRWFDYDAFWQEFKGEVGSNDCIYLLPVPPPDRPIEEIRRNHRNRTLRKRKYKRELREQVAQYWLATFAAPNAAKPLISLHSPAEDAELEVSSALIATDLAEAAL